MRDVTRRGEGPFTTSPEINLAATPNSIDNSSETQNCGGFSLCYRASRNPTRVFTFFKIAALFHQFVRLCRTCHQACTCLENWIGIVSCFRCVPLLNRAHSSRGKKKPQAVHTAGVLRCVCTSVAQRQLGGAALTETLRAAHPP